MQPGVRQHCLLPPCLGVADHFCMQAEGEGDYIDLSEHQMVSFRVFGDGRKYIANFRTENWIVGSRNHDVWQAFLFARC